MMTVEYDIQWHSWRFLDTETLHEDNTCIKCYKILEKPMLVECCGTHLCQKCAEPVLQSGKLLQCFNCNQKLVACIVDKRKWKHILDLAIFCPLHNRGCQWTGDIKGSDDHLSSECQYMSIECTAGCGESVERHELTDHLETVCQNRSTTCQYCGVDGQVCDIAGDHLSICSQYYIQCQNGCGESILKMSYSEHLNNCPEFAVPCKYNFVGCRIIVKRKLMQRHLLENVQKHSLLQSKLVTQRLKKSASEQLAQLELGQRIQDYHTELVETDINQMNFISTCSIEESKLKSLKQVKSTTRVMNLKLQECKYKITQLFDNLEETIKRKLKDTPSVLWELDPTNIQFEFKLESGQFDESWTGYKNENQIIIKKHKSESITSSKFMQEAFMLERFNHEGILSLIGVSTKSKPILIVMEHAAQSLLSFITNQTDQLTITNQTTIIQQVVSGMAHIESLRCIHRAVNSSSVLIRNTLQCKIGNFKFAKVLDIGETEYEIPQGERVPIKWSPPEALLYNKFTIKSDVWAFGILQYEVMNRSLLKMPNRKAENFIETGGSLNCPLDCPKKHYEVINNCLNQDPETRPTFTALLEEEHFKLTDNKSFSSKHDSGNFHNDEDFYDDLLTIRKDEELYTKLPTIQTNQELYEDLPNILQELQYEDEDIYDDTLAMVTDDSLIEETPCEDFSTFIKKMNSLRHQTGLNM